MDFSERLVLVIAALSFTVLILGLLLIPAPNATEPSKANETNQSVEPPEPPKTDVWSLLNSQNVEVQCLKQARAFAVKSGVPEFAVSGCRCSANETADVKIYDCTISAIDGDYDVDAKCVKADERCLFTSMGGAIVYTFDEMEKLMID